LTSCALRLGLPAAVLLFAAAAPAQERPPDPVEALAQALQAPSRDPKARDAALAAACRRLRTLDDLGVALALSEWREHAAEEALAAVDRRHRAAVLDRFEQAARAALRQRELGPRLHALTTIAGLDAALACRFGPDVASLLSQDPPVLREAAARALGRIGADPAIAVAALAGLLRHPDPQLRVVAGEVLADLIVHVTRPGETDRGAEVVAVCAAVVPAAAAGLADSSTEVRRRCGGALARAAAALSGLVLAPLPGAANDPDVYRRQVEEERAALGPLIRALSAQAAPLALAAADPDVRVRLLARRALDDVAEARLRLILRTHSALGLSGKHTPREFRERALAFLNEDPLLHPLRAAVLVLAAALEDPDVRGRLAAIDVLETMGPHAAPAVPALVGALSDGDRFVRWSAARALGKVRPGDPSAVVPHLARLLGEADPDVRLTAADSLLSYGQAARAAVPGLLEAARSNDARLRVAALRVLERVGRDEASALAVLSAALNDPDARVRRAAAALLRSPPSAPDRAFGSAAPPR
jgi:HEAT repeat protein